MLPNYKISHSVFEQISSSGSGGVFSLYQGSIVVECSKFVSDTAQQFGGCIYCSQASIELKKSSFFKCASLAYQNNIRGNVLSCIDGKGILENIDTELCSYSEKECSDSCISFYSSQSIISLFNATSNYGLTGGSGCSCLESIEGTSMSFINIVEGRDSYMIEAQTNHYIVKKANFIDCSHCVHKAVGYANLDYLYTFISCVFKQMGDTKIVVNSHKYYVEDCQAEGSFENIEEVSNPSTIFVQINLKCNIYYSSFNKLSKSLENIRITLLLLLFMLSSR